MRNPFGRPRRASGRSQRDVEAALRAGLHRLAADADRRTDSDLVAARVLAATEPPGETITGPVRSLSGSARPLRGAGPSRRRRARLVAPLVAAAAVIAIIGSVIALETRPGHHDGPAGASSLGRPPTSSPSSPTRVVVPPPPAKPSPSSAPTSRSTGPAGLSIADLTFSATDIGWALGTIDTGGGDVRPVLLHTTDGRTWHSVGTAPFAVGPAAVEHIRFVTDQAGYAFGPDQFWTTGDGGGSWTRQSGGALALESLRGNVLRVRDDGGRYSVEQVAIGSVAWSPVALPGPQGQQQGALLTRAGRRVFLGDFGSPGSAAKSAQAVLWTSSDNGASFTRHGDPCRASNGPEVDMVNFSSSTGGRLTVACHARTGDAAPFTITSTDGGEHFSTGRAIPGQHIAPLTAVASASTLAVTDRVYRSTDGGRHWTAVADLPPIAVGTIDFIGFEDDQVGRIAADGQIWTTRDAGRTWQRAVIR